MPPSYFSGYKGGYACSLQHRGAVRPKDVPPPKKNKARVFSAWAAGE